MFFVLYEGCALLRPSYLKIKVIDGGECHGLLGLWGLRVH